MRVEFPLGHAGLLHQVDDELVLLARYTIAVAFLTIGGLWLTIPTRRAIYPSNISVASIKPMVNTHKAIFENVSGL